MGQAGIALNVIATAVGAAMAWAVSYHGIGFRPSTLGVILTIVGVTSAIASSLIVGVVSDSAGRRRLAAPFPFASAGSFQIVREAIASPSRKKVDQSWP